MHNYSQTVEHGKIPSAVYTRTETTFNGDRGTEWFLELTLSNPEGLSPEVRLALNEKLQDALNAFDLAAGYDGFALACSPAPGSAAEMVLKPKESNDAAERLTAAAAALENEFEPVCVHQFPNDESSSKRLKEAAQLLRELGMKVSIRVSNIDADALFDQFGAEPSLEMLIKEIEYSGA